MKTFEYRSNDFFMDGKKFKLLSGSIHYFRVHPDYWMDRLIKLKQCGFNTVDTYIAWNMIEKEKGKFDFSGINDFVRYIEIAGEVGLHVIVRPGPYICSEWDFGGLPAWLLAEHDLVPRSSEKKFMSYASRYLNKVLEKLIHLQYTNGGPIIMMQVENEYCAFGNDQRYQEQLRDLMLEAGVNVPLFISGGARLFSERFSPLPGVAYFPNFRNHPKKVLESLMPTLPEKYPALVAELWVGAESHWNEMLPVHDAAEVAEDIAEILDNDLHCNVYMFHGGTNFGFMNGANYDASNYQPYLSTYDLGAPLGEDGNPTEKYYLIQKEFAKRGYPTESPTINPNAAYGKVELDSCVSLAESLELLSEKHETVMPKSMEYFGQNLGFILYRTRIENVPGMQNMVLAGLKDRAVVSCDGKIIAEVYRNDSPRQIPVKISPEGSVIDVLVENMGRYNIGPDLVNERKGLEAVRFPFANLMHWEIYPLPLDDISKLKFRDGQSLDMQPGFYKGILRIDKKPQDTFIKVPDGTKGIVFINGFNLGRYWNVGPQKTLYIPAPLMKQGENQIVVFEQQGLSERFVEFVDHKDFGARLEMQA